MAAIPLNHPATLAARAANTLIEMGDVRLSGRRRQRDYATLHDAIQATDATLQYLRRFVQGCACATGIAGGGCCPGNAAGLAAQGSHAMHGARMIPMGILGITTGPYGVWSGYKVHRNARDAQLHLRGVRRTLERQSGNVGLYAAQLARFPALVQARRAAQHTLQALRGYHDDVRISEHEQAFNHHVPGTLQIVAGSAVTVGGINALGMGCMGAIGGCIIGAVGAGLFALFGGLMASKNAFTWWLNMRLGAIDDNTLPDAYRNAANDHMQAHRQSAGRAAMAWAGVAAAGLFGTLVATGVVAFPGAWAAVTGFALLAAGGAMWQNSRTRYVPHLPISPHTDREELVTNAQRATRWAALKAQDEVIKHAVAQLVTLQPQGTRWRYDFERLFKPQCGPSAFQVLATRVQEASPELRAQYEGILLAALLAYTTHEHALLRNTLSAKSKGLKHRQMELNSLVNPCCAQMTEDARQALKPAAATEPVYTQVANRQRDDATAYEQATRKLSVLELLQDTLKGLRGEVGMLRGNDAWVWARINALRLSGTLGEAVPQGFVDANPQLFSRNSGPQALPINNLYVLPEQQQAFAQAVAPLLDGAFVHAFFNPRRIEAEMDFILDREWNARAATEAAEASLAAPACDSGTCCR